MAGLAASMKERTGRTLDEWVTLVQSEGPDPLDQKAVRTWLKDVHGVAQNSQWAIADAAAVAAGWERATVRGYTDALYTGARAGLRPLHDAVVELALSMGEDTEAQGRSTYVPVVRKTQFVAVAPGPRGTLRVGLRYQGEAPSGERLSPAKGFAQATHWLHLPADAAQADVDSLAPLLAAAYGDNG